MVQIKNKQFKVTEDFDINNQNVVQTLSIRLKDTALPISPGKLRLHNGRLLFEQGLVESDILIGSVATLSEVGTIWGAGKFFKLDANGKIPVSALPTVGVGLGEEFTTDHKNKLEGLGGGPGVSNTWEEADAYLLDRTNHTGTQLSTSISDFVTAVTTQVNSILSTTSINVFTDVDIVTTPPTPGQTLVWDGVSKFLPGTISGGGGGAPDVFNSSNIGAEITVVSDPPPVNRTLYRIEHGKGYKVDAKLYVPGTGGSLELAVCDIIYRSGTMSTHVDIGVDEPLSGAWEIHIR